jgi:hypothetical protein
MQTDEQRFLSKVDKTGKKGCWRWKAGADKDGYGVFWANKKWIRAHRFSYVTNIGTIPKGLFVLHDCDNPACVNPAHLFLGTGTDNAKDRDAKGRLSWGEVHATSKLSNAEVLKIRNTPMRRGICTAMSKKYNVAISQICRIVKGESWKRLSQLT